MFVLCVCVESLSLKKKKKEKEKICLCEMVSQSKQNKTIKIPPGIKTRQLSLTANPPLGYSSSQPTLMIVVAAQCTHSLRFIIPS